MLCSSVNFLSNIGLLHFYPTVSLHDHIERQGIEFLQFTFRWMNNLLMRELPLRCTIRLWDTYLVCWPAASRRASFLCGVTSCYFTLFVSHFIPLWPDVHSIGFVGRAWRVCQLSPVRVRGVPYQVLQTTSEAFRFPGIVLCPPRVHVISVMSYLVTDNRIVTSFRAWWRCYKICPQTTGVMPTLKNLPPKLTDLNTLSLTLRNIWGPRPDVLWRCMLGTDCCKQC